jgi:hypothetical protein
MKQEDQIEQILNSAKGAGQVDPNPYLFNKIVTRLKERTEEAYQTRPVLVWLSVSVMALLIAVNVFTLLSGNVSEEGQNMESVVSYYSLKDQSGLNY